jgi:hypothetical protein
MLTDGQPTQGTGLETVVTMSSRTEAPIAGMRGLNGPGVEQGTGREVPLADTLGAGLAIKTRHPIHVFFVGVGADADLNVGRILAEATHSACIGVGRDPADKTLPCQGSTDRLDAVLATFGKYF